MNFFGLVAIWLISYILATIFIRQRTSFGKTILYSQLINVSLAAIIMWIWFNFESEGFSQVFGSLIIGGISIIAIPVTLIWLYLIKKQTNS